MNWIASPSVERDCFHLLDERIQRWAFDRGWKSLRGVQNQAIPLLLAGQQDVIISAHTASGKTEAAFLPILSRIAHEKDLGFQVIYLAPLKALINDQFQRLELLCSKLNLPVYPWHGDVSSALKRKARNHPQGVVLMTPESLEAVLITHTMHLPALFSTVRYIVIDELHAFIGTERGIHLQSLLARLEHLFNRMIPRVGLSATLGDVHQAAEYVRPGQASQVACVKSANDRYRAQLKIFGVVQPPVHTSVPCAEEMIAHALFQKLRGDTHLIFAGSRNNVEFYADALREQSEAQNVPNEFFPHHGTLSKELREALEKRLKESHGPTTAVCTTTLELGIDIGPVSSVVQIGAPRSIAAVRQRLGRSGRREGASPVLRLYLIEEAWKHDMDLSSALRIETVMAVSAVYVLSRGWCEPAIPHTLHLSTLIHQILAITAQKGGVALSEIDHILCQNGPFHHVQTTLLIEVLRSMARPEQGLLIQTSNGLLMLGPKGEYLVNHYSFYAVFQTKKEYRLFFNRKCLGNIPLVFLMPGDCILHGGRRWEISAICHTKKNIDVVPARIKKLIPCSGYRIPVHDVLMNEVHAVYRDERIPSFLDATAKDFLMEGRKQAQHLNILHQRIIENEQGIVVFLWVGTRKQVTFALALKQRGLHVSYDDVSIAIAAITPKEFMIHLKNLMMYPPSPVRLAETAQPVAEEKFDLFLTQDLLYQTWSSKYLDCASVPELAHMLMQWI